jgi:MshEN domain
MDPHHRFHRRSLRDVLIAQGVLTSEVADELVTAARESHEPFGAVVVEAGRISSWDLAKVVAAHYQMPVLPLAGFQWDRDLMDGVSPATLYQYQVVPVGRFGTVWSFAVVEPPSRDCLDALREECGNSLFFFVSEAPEVQRLLRENVKVVDVSTDQSWKSIFDTADQNVLEGLEGADGAA